MIAKFQQYPRHQNRIDLGQHYIISIFGRPMRVRFIQPTEKGYNFLNIDTAKCVLKHHLYPQKNTTNIFWMGSYCRIVSKYELTTESFAS